MNKISFTALPNVFAPAVTETTTLDWSNFVDLFRKPAIADTPELNVAMKNRIKLANPCYSPALFEQAGVPRKKEYVRAFQLCVYDVDSEVKAADIYRLRQALEASGLHYILHSTYDHCPTALSYRLIIPAAKVFPSAHLSELRRVLFHHFKPPAKLVYGSDFSRVFLFPGTHASRAQYYEFYTSGPDAVPYDPAVHKFGEEPKDVAHVTGASVTPSRDLEEPPETEQGVDIEKLRKQLQRNLKRMDDSKEVKVFLDRMLNNHVIASVGARDDALHKLTAYLVFVLPDQTAYSTYFRLLEPTIRISYPDPQEAEVALTKLRDKIKRDFRDKQIKREQKALFADKMEALLREHRERMAALAVKYKDGKIWG